MTSESLSGWLLAVAYLLPLLGAVMKSRLGAHPRAIALACLGLSALLALGTPAAAERFRLRLQGQRLLLALSFLLYLILIALNVDWDGGATIFFSERDLWSRYDASKLPRFLTLAVPQILVGYLVAPAAMRPGFWRGFSTGVLCVGLLGLNLVYGSLTGLTSKNYNSYTEASIYWSHVNVGTHLAIVFGFAQERFLSAREPLARVIYFAYAVVLAIAVLMVDQRAQFLALFIPFAIWVYRRSRVVFFVVAGVLGSVLSSLLLAASKLGLFWQVQRMSRLFSGQDGSLAARLNAWLAVIVDLPTNATGQGFAAFYHRFPSLRYPHNIILESAYELGWLAAAVSAWWVWSAVANLKPEIKRGLFSGVSFAIVVELVVMLKAQDCTGIGGLILVLFLYNSRRLGIKELSSDDVQRLVFRRK